MKAHMKIQAKTEVILSSAKEHQGPVEPGRGKEVFSSRTFRGGITLLPS